MDRPTEGRYWMSTRDGASVLVHVEFVATNGRTVVRLLVPTEPRMDIPADKVTDFTWEKVAQ